MGHFGSGIQFEKPGAVPYSMIAADLNGDHRPEIIVDFVEAPGKIYYNDGTGNSIREYHSATAKARSMVWRREI
jgi:hypothetical protein